MAKSKKSDSEKIPKDKELKALKKEKAGKEKKSKKKDKPAAAKVAKVAVAPKPEKPAPKAKKVTEPAVSFSTEQISLRAYYIAERRQAMGWPGDSSSDWAEAERQLKTEARKKASL